jgi:hypothetical protein
MDHLPPRSEEGTKKLMQGHRKGRTRPSNLREQVDPETMRLWRTPDAHCDRGASSAKRMQMKVDKKMPISLNDQVAHPNIMWPTPNRADHLANQSETLEAWEKRAAEKKKEGINLQFALRHAAQMWPTPREFMYKDSKVDRGKSNLGEKVGGSLNPMWVEWLMGYPVGYTDLKDWEILSSRKSRKK